MTSVDLDMRLRMAAFSWLEKQAAMNEEVVPREVLLRGFDFEGERVPLISPQGIFKPKQLPRFPLSITTTPGSPYNDHITEDNLLQYRYRGTDPNHRDNVGLRDAMQSRIPLVYLYGLIPGKYLPIWPVYIIGDDQSRFMFRVVADSPSDFFQHAQNTFSLAIADTDPASRRAYVTRGVKVRLHQRGFRERVLSAYREQCACCKLSHVELLDAAHIIGDSKPEGEPKVTNGIALCKLHHKAFDVNIFGIRPDYFMEVRQDVLEEHDGPMLLHGLQGLHNKKLILPRHDEFLPDKLLLERRWEEFKLRM